MTDQEASIKMAEMYGYKTDVFDNEVMIIIGQSKYGKKFLKKWNPKEDIAQMMEVMKSLKNRDVCYCMSNQGDFIGCDLFSEDFIDEDSLVGSGFAEIESKAMFQAVKKWMEAENDRC